MARNINSRLNQLKTRRQGMDRLGRLAQDAQLEVIAKSLETESWQKRASYEPYTRYALGAMQEVGPEYTRISIETAKRVGKQLANSISSIEFELQGSVPLNVHIRGVSDVDLLTLDTSFLVYDGWGVSGQGGGYCANNPTLYAIADAIMALKIPPESIRVVSIGVGVYPAPKLSWFNRTKWAQMLRSVQLLQKTLEINTQSMDQLRDILFKHVPTVRISETFRQPEMATDLFEHDLRKLNILRQRGKGSFAKYEATLREYLSANNGIA